MTRTAASRCPSTRRQVRDLQRLTHLLGAALLLVYIYVAPHLGAGFVAAVRWFVVPVVVASGMACGNGRGSGRCYAEAGADPCPEHR
jgi:hypothetical protein